MENKKSLLGRKILFQWKM